jgi:adenylate cyclase
MAISGNVAWPRVKFPSIVVSSSWSPGAGWWTHQLLATMMTPSPGTTELKIPRDLRFASGLVLFAYITTHLSNHGLGLISLDAAETGLWLLTAMWHSLPGTLLLYSAAGLHFVLAIRSIYERRTFRLPPLELLRIALGFWMPVLLLGHAITTRLEFELIESPTTYARVVSDLWATDSEWRQLGLLAPGWLHGCLGFHFALCRHVLYQKLRPVLIATALLLPVLSALGFVAMGKETRTGRASRTGHSRHSHCRSGDQRASDCRAACEAEPLAQRIAVRVFRNYRPCVPGERDPKLG